MFRNYLFLFFLLLVTAATKAQVAVTDTALLNKMGDFDMATLNNDVYGAMLAGEQILPDTAKLPAKARTSFFAKLAKAYDDAEQDGTAIIYYEKVADAEPNYFVVQRALGYLYNDKAEEIQLKLYLTPKNDVSYARVFDDYKKAALKALPYLEKAQACDPDDDTLDLIKTLYINIHYDKGLNSLNRRLPDLAKSCVDLLEDK